jgi:hypothetical protein
LKEARRVGASRPEWSRSRSDARRNLSEISDRTGGESYYLGFGAPVSFAPYLDDLSHRLPAFGTLTGRIPRLDRCLLAISLTPYESAYFAECFDEGAVLLVVHTHELEQRNVAARLLRRRGGFMAAGRFVVADEESRCVVKKVRPKPGLKVLQLLAAWKAILGGSSPMLSIEITRECPLHCPGCYAYGDMHLGGSVTLRELSDYRGHDLVDGVVSLVRRHRPLHVSLVGGEPLVRHRELSRILPILSGMGVHTMVVKSAVIPIPPHWMSIPRVRVAVSIDGLSSTTTFVVNRPPTSSSYATSPALA